MNWKYVLLLVLGWFLYLGAGGGIFHLTEAPNEKAVADRIYQAKEAFLSESMQDASGVCGVRGMFVLAELTESTKPRKHFSVSTEEAY